MDRHTRGPVNKPSLRAGRKKTENKRHKEIERKRDYSYFISFNGLWLRMKMMWHCDDEGKMHT